jgi:alpha-1,3-glucosyltransferase
MLQVENLNYASESTVLFQRLTVIVSELVLYWAVQRYHLNAENDSESIDAS